MNMLSKLKEPRNSAAFTAINILLGVGPLIIPEPFFRTGFLFSFIWTIVVCLLGYNSAHYIGQSILLINQHMDEQKALCRDSQKEEIIDGESQGQEPDYIRTFDHVEQFAYLYGNKWKLFPSLAVAFYLLGAAVSKCIMTGNTLSKLFDEVTVLNTYYFWLGLFFVFGAAFSFKSIQKTKLVQITMILVRFVSILLMIVGSFIILGQNGGTQYLAPAEGNAFFNGKYFGDIFSNLLFAFMIHHSMPGITKQLTELKQIRSFLNIGFLVSGATMLIIPITACLAFGNQLVNNPAGRLHQGHELVYYNQDFKDRINFIYYFVSFYVFLNIALFPVYIIVIRRNLMAILRPDLNPDRLSRTTIFISSVILAVVLIISFALRDYIQTALNFTGGILGCCILFFIPSMEVLKARSLFPVKKSFLNSAVWMPYAIIVIGFVSMGFNLYQTILSLTE